MMIRWRTVTSVRHLISARFQRTYSTKLAPVNFNHAVKEAEKVVGYPTSFLNLRWLLNDEIATIASQIRKLITIDHPLVTTAREIVLQSEVPTWGLVILLVAKAGGLKNTTNAIEIDHTAGILHNQRVLAELSEMIRTSTLVHKAVLNPSNKFHDAKDVAYGNKLALLCGDYLLSKCFNDLAVIGDHNVNQLISSTLRDLAENEFLGQRDAQNFPLPSRPHCKQSLVENLVADCDMGPYDVNAILGHSKPEWFLRSILGGANLLAKSCRAVCLLDKQDEGIQQAAYLLGKLMGLAWQAKLDLDMFRKKQFSNYFLVSAPVMWALHKCPDLYGAQIVQGVENVHNCDFEQIHDMVTKSGAFGDCCKTQNVLIEQARCHLQLFPQSAATKSLNDLLDALTVEDLNNL